MTYSEVFKQEGRQSIEYILLEKVSAGTITVYQNYGSDTNVVSYVILAL